MSLNAHYCWAVVTRDESKAVKVFTQVSKSKKKDGIDFITIRKRENYAEIVYEDGVCLKWIRPITNCKGSRFHRLWCDINIDQDYFEQVILPMACYMKYEDIVWI